MTIDTLPVLYDPCLPINHQGEAWFSARAIWHTIERPLRRIGTFESWARKNLLDFDGREPVLDFYTINGRDPGLERAGGVCTESRIDYLITPGVAVDIIESSGPEWAFITRDLLQEAEDFNHAQAEAEALRCAQRDDLLAMRESWPIDGLDFNCSPTLRASRLYTEVLGYEPRARDFASFCLVYIQERHPVLSANVDYFVCADFCVIGGETAQDLMLTSRAIKIVCQMLRVPAGLAYIKAIEQAEVLGVGPLTDSFRYEKISAVSVSALN